MIKNNEADILSLYELRSRLTLFKEETLKHCAVLENRLSHILDVYGFPSSAIDLTNLNNDITEIRKTLNEVQSIQNHIKNMIDINTGGPVNICNNLR